MADSAFTAWRVIPYTLALLVSGCVYFSRHTLPGACRDDLDSPIRNFCVVTPGALWRGETPTHSDAQWLVDHGVRTIVSLQLDVRLAFESVHPGPGVVRSVTYFRVRDFAATQVLTHRHMDDHVAEVLAIIEEAPKPVFISCRAGVDRTGIIAAAYRVLVDGMSRPEAIREMEAFHSPWDLLNARYVRGLTGARKARILRNVTQWRSRLRPVGRFDCRAGRCRLRVRRSGAGLYRATR
ncbi:MAG TPA: tyrosine-protein phosphatase [Steroidobacteraceae bacterium]|nr:tyrosine-protein phosphatase [Steroidobacteraceae bacterium]